mmetsp:Transcript_29423/g.62638  ORF Transcript_29423/g.62638 Transcript_29423/m.62638 type:complete len:219 (+) Transcript_29423:205-861(+)
MSPKDICRTDPFNSITKFLSRLSREQLHVRSCPSGEMTPICWPRTIILTKDFIACCTREASRWRAGMRSWMYSLAMLLVVPKLRLDLTERELATLVVSASRSACPVEGSREPPAPAFTPGGSPPRSAGGEEDLPEPRPPPFTAPSPFSRGGPWPVASSSPPAAFDGSGFSSGAPSPCALPEDLILSASPWAAGAQQQARPQLIAAAAFRRWLGRLAAP